VPIGLAFQADLLARHRNRRTTGEQRLFRPSARWCEVLKQPRQRQL